MLRRLIITTVVATVSMFAIPSIAAAADYCVGTTPVVCPVQDFSNDAAGLILARNAANGTPGADRIFLGAGSYGTQPATLNLGFSDKIEIIGAGRSQVSFPWSTAAGTAAVDLQFPTSDSYMSGFTVDLTGTPNAATGMSVLGGEIRDFAINDDTVGTTGTVTGFSLKSGAKASNFDSTLTGVNAGIAMTSGDATVEDGEIIATGTEAYGIAAGTSADLNIRRLKIRGVFLGVNLDLGNVNISDTSVDIADNVGGTGLNMINLNSPGSPNAINATLDRVTIHGSAANQRAIRVGADDASNESFAGTIRDSVFHTTHPNAAGIVCIKANSRPVTLDIQRSAFDPMKYIEFGSPPPVIPPPTDDCAETFADNLDTTVAVPTFVDANAGDLRPAAGSPMIDVSDGGASLASGALDAAGAARVVDGNGDCTAKLDLGAYEFQLPTPQNCLPQTPPTTPPTTQPLATAKLTTRAKKAFVRSKSGFRKRNNPKATAFGVTFKNAQVARFEIQQVLRGVKKGKTCKKGSKGGKRCTFYKKIPGIQRQDVYDGEIFYQFGGQIGGKKLKPGNYRVIITPFGEGAVMGTPLAVPFKLK